MQYLFVYGTLLKDIINEMSEFLKANAEFYSKGYFYGRLYNIDYYPGAITSTNKNEKVYGNIFSIKDENVISVLDDYEEVGEKYPQPNEYIRKKISVFTDNNEETKSWVYLYNHSTNNLERIESGDFLEFLKDNK